MPLFLWSENVKLKLDEQGNAVLQDGKPVYVHDDGKEVPFDAPGAMAKIASLNAEAQTHRDRSGALRAWVLHSTTIHNLYDNALTNAERLFTYEGINVVRDPFGRNRGGVDKPVPARWQVRCGGHSPASKP